jgi:hypothetical protein
MLKVVSQLRSMKIRAFGRSSSRLRPSECTLVKNTPVRFTSSSKVA